MARWVGIDKECFYYDLMQNPLLGIISGDGVMLLSKYTSWREAEWVKCGGPYMTSDDG